MIRYTLQCADGHKFEGWFPSIATYEKQEATGEVACTACGSTKVTRAIMAPALGAGVAAAGDKHTGGPDCPVCAGRRKALRQLPTVPDLHDHMVNGPGTPAKGPIANAEQLAEVVERAEGKGKIFEIPKEDA